MSKRLTIKDYQQKLSDQALAIDILQKGLKESQDSCSDLTKETGNLLEKYKHQENRLLHVGVNVRSLLVAINAVYYSRHTQEIKPDEMPNGQITYHINGSRQAREDANSQFMLWLKSEMEAIDDGFNLCCHLEDKKMGNYE